MTNHQPFDITSLGRNAIRPKQTWVVLESKVSFVGEKEMSDQSSGKESKNGGKIGWVKIVFVVLAALIIVTPFVGPRIITWCCSSPSDFWQTAGQFGDTCGVFNALFSGLALLFIGWTLYLQRRQLETQEKELHQNTTLMAQQIADNKFFTLFHQLRQYISETRFESHEGHNSYIHLWVKLRDQNDQFKKNGPTTYDLPMPLRNFFSNEKYIDRLRPFFCFTEMLYAIIDETESKNKVNVNRWSDLIRSLFNGEELNLLYYYSWYENYCKKPEMGQLFEKHRLFKDFNPSLETL